MAAVLCFPPMIDDGPAIHYAAVGRGTPVYASDGTEVGRVDQVVDNYREHILDGIVILTENGELVFADGPEVSRTAERGVTLGIDAAAAARLPEPPPAAGSVRAKLRAGRFGSLLGVGRRHGRGR